MKALLTQPKLRPPLLTHYWQWSINPFTPLMMMLQTSAMSFQSRGLVCQRYLFQHANRTNHQLVDRGANGGLAGSDMRVIHKTHRTINIQGIDNHEVTGLDVVTAATLLNTSQGKVIGIFNEYAYLGKGSSIHSSGQLEWLQTNVHETSVKVGGTQLITTLDGYSVPLLIKDGLAYATSLGRPTDLDMDTYPHVFFTSPDELDPSQVPDQLFGDPMSDACGDFNKHIIANLNTLLDAISKPTPQQTAKSQQVYTHQSDESTTDTTKTETTPSDPLLAMVHQSIHTSDDDASDISNVLSVKRSRQIQVCQCYLFQHANHTNHQLVDRGANGGLAGSDMRGIHRTYRKIKIQDIDNHEVTGLDVVTAATLLNTPQGKVIGVFNEYAYLWKGSSIHSSGQLEWLQTNVHETYVKVGGTQLINTLDGYSVPLLIKDGLAYATSLGRPTDLDMDTYPHFFFLHIS